MAGPSIVWAPMRKPPPVPPPPDDYWDTFVPKVERGLRVWDKDGPRNPDAAYTPPPRGPNFVYQWHGPRLVCSNRPGSL